MSLNDRQNVPHVISGLQSYTQGDVTVDFTRLAVEIIEKAFKDEPKEKRESLLHEVVTDFEEKRKHGFAKFPGATFRLAILAAHNGRCQICGKARLQMFSSDAGERICFDCVRELEDEINLGIKVRPPREPEGGTGWLTEKT